METIDQVLKELKKRGECGIYKNMAISSSACLKKERGRRPDIELVNLNDSEYWITMDFLLPAWCKDKPIPVHEDDIAEVLGDLEQIDKSVGLFWTKYCPTLNRITPSKTRNAILSTLSECTNPAETALKTVDEIFDEISKDGDCEIYGNLRLSPSTLLKTVTDRADLKMVNLDSSEYWLTINWAWTVHCRDKPVPVRKEEIEDVLKDMKAMMTNADIFWKKYCGLLGRITSKKTGSAILTVSSEIGQSE